MYPIVVTIPGINYDVSSFGVMMIAGFLTAYALTVRELPRKGIDPQLGLTILTFATVGGVLGSKLYFTIDMMIREGQPFADYFFRSDGITWYGGLGGGLLASALASRLYGFKLRDALDAAAPAVALGQSLGRIGCFLVGDDYGRATSLPWGVAFPNGSPPILDPVHATQLYEVAWLLPVAWLLYKRRDVSPFLFGEYMVANGFGRIFIEHLRLNPEIAFGLTQPQWIGITLVASGAILWVFYERQHEIAAV